MKANDIHIMYLVCACRTLFEKTNIDAQYTLIPYATTSYCTSYFTKLDKSITQEIKIILKKCKHEQTNALKIYEMHLKCTTNVYTTSFTHYIIHTIIPFNKIISSYKHMSTTR